MDTEDKQWKYTHCDPFPEAGQIYNSPEITSGRRCYTKTERNGTTYNSDGVNEIVPSDITVKTSVPRSGNGTAGKTNGGIYRQYDSSAIVLISAYKKVQQILNGEIPVPEVVEIFPTNYCNFHCPHCRFEGYHGDSSQYMSLTVLENLLEELKERDVKAIELSGGGEPFEHPQIEEFMQNLVAGQFRAGIITNGYRLTQSDRLKGQILQCANWIRFSVDGFTEHTYRIVHGNKHVHYADLSRSIHELVNAERPILSVEMKMLISKLNYHECVKAIEEAGKLGVDCLQFKFLGNHPCALDDHAMKLTEEKIRKMIDQTNGFKVELIPPFRGERPSAPCLMTYLHPVIDWNGEIYICAFFEHRKMSHTLGNINDGGFFKHWDAARHKELFESIRSETCVPNCPMQRYNPVIDFIKADAYRFQFI